MTRHKTLLDPRSPPSRRVTPQPGRADGGTRLGAAFIAAGFVIASGCAGSQTPPTQLMADVQSANRSAAELGAQNHPQAKLHLKLAEEQLNQAKVALENDEDERAEGLLMRAKADAELAVALAREDTATHRGGSMEQAAPQPAPMPRTGATQ